MTSRATVEDFLAQKKLALAGASRDSRKFGNVVLRELLKKGYEVLPVHPHANELEGVPCLRTLADLPPDTGGLIIVVPPAQTERLVGEAAAAGVRRVWMQQGAASSEAVAFCEAHGMSVVRDECILLFAEPVGGVHRVHRWIWKVLGRMPK